MPTGRRRRWRRGRRPRAERLVVAAGLAVETRPAPDAAPASDAGWPSMIAAAVVLAGCVGAAVGSFLNVVIWRLPRGESVVSPRLALPGLRHAESARTTTSRCSRGRAARPLPRLRRADPRALPAGRGADGAAVRPGRPPGPEHPGSASPSSGAARAGDLHRPRSPHHPQRADGDRGRDRGRAPAAARPRVARRAPRRRGGRGRLSSWSAVAYPAGMGMGDVKLAAVLGLFLGSAVGPRCSSRCSPARSSARDHRPQGRDEGRKTAIPFGPYLASAGSSPCSGRRDGRLVPAHLRLASTPPGGLKAA